MIILSFIEDIYDICCKHKTEGLFVGKDISERKLENVYEEFPISRDEEIIAVIDATVFGSCKYGLAIGTKGLYVNNDWTGTVRRGFLSWDDLKDAHISMVNQDEVEVVPNFTVVLSGSSVEMINFIAFLVDFQDYMVKKGTKKLETQWWVAIQGRKYGPYTTSKIVEKIHNHELVIDTFVWKRGMDQWGTLGTVSEFQETLAVVPPPLPMVESEVLEVIELNRASICELLLLPGIDLNNVQLFIEERARKGRFDAYQEVKEVLKVQPQEFEEIERLTVLDAVAILGAGKVIDFHKGKE